jgi:hypothetical protein
LVKKKYIYEGLLESGYADAIDEETIAVVKDYNKDDCISTKYLRDWLEKLRQALIDEKKDIPRPTKEDENPIRKHYGASTKDPTTSRRINQGSIIREKRTRIRNNRRNGY